MNASEPPLLYLTVDVQHPNCWTLETTRETGGGLLGHGAAVDETRAVGWYTAFGESRGVVDRLTETIQSSHLTTAMTPLAPSESGSSVLGRATQDILVEFDSTPMIRPAFAARDFISHGPTRHEADREQRSFLTAMDRPSVKDAIAEIETAYDADIDLTRLTAMKPPTWMHAAISDQLSPRQREAFELARDGGYYSYPRGATAGRLAEILGISKATFLEHLRKAEAKLLTGVELR